MRKIILLLLIGNIVVISAEAQKVRAKKQLVVTTKVKKNTTSNLPIDTLVTSIAPVEMPKAIDPPAPKQIYRSVEVKAYYMGGDSAISKLIADNMVYPEDALEKSITGIVDVEFIVDKNGVINNPTIVKAVCKSIDKEALRIVGLMGNYKPARINGKPIGSVVTLPIVFELEK